MNYTLHQLSIFIKVAELQSVTKASEELHLTQPAVSIQLKKLQEQFDIPLIEVIGKKVFVTEFGQEIVESSRKILDEVKVIQNKTHAFKGHLVGQLKISVVSTGKYVIPYFLTDFSEQFPNVELKIDVTNKQKVLQAIEQNEVDFALVSVLPENLKLNRVELMQNKLYLTRRKSQGEQSKYMQVRSLEKQSLIYREQGSATRQAMERFLSKNNISQFKSIELTSNEAVKQAVIAGLGYSIMPLIGIKSALINNDIEIVPVKGLPIITNWNLIWLREKRVSPVAEAYLKYIQEFKQQVVEKHFQWYEKY